MSLGGFMRTMGKNLGMAVPAQAGGKKKKTCKTKQGGKKSKGKSMKKKNTKKQQGGKKSKGKKGKKTRKQRK